MVVVDLFTMVVTAGLIVVCLRIDFCGDPLCFPLRPTVFHTVLGGGFFPLVGEPFCPVSIGSGAMVDDNKGVEVGVGG